MGLISTNTIKYEMRLQDKVNLDKFEFKDGIYYLKNSEIEAKNINYPENAHDTCFELEDASYWFRHRNHVIRTVISNYPPYKQEIFDVGGGNGNTSSYLVKNGYDVVMFEPMQRGVKNAQKRGGGKKYFLFNI